MCFLAAQYLQVDGLAVPVSCNSAIESCAFFAKIERTKIGSPYVVEAFSGLAKEYQRVAGFEAGGGLLGNDLSLNQQVLTSQPIRDAILPVLVVLALAGTDMISTLLTKLPNSFTASDRLQDFAREKSVLILANTESDSKAFIELVGLSKLAVIKVDKAGGLRMTLSDESVIHLRSSGNATELKYYAETNNQSKAEALVNNVLSTLR